MAANKDNLRGPYTPEEARYYGSLGGKKRAENIQKRKSLGALLKAWADQNPSEKDKAVLKKIFPEDEELSNKALLVIPLIKKANSGDIKAIEMIVKLLGEDRKLEAEIEKLKSENELLKSGAGFGLEPIVIKMDVKSDE